MPDPGRETLPWCEEAQARLGARLSAYLLGAAHDATDHSAHADADLNHSRLARHRLLPRVLATQAMPSAGIVLFGRPLSAPLAVGAFAGDRLFHPEGLLPVAAACRRLGLPLIVSEETVTPLAALCQAAPNVWLQLRAAGDPQRVRRLIDAAAAAGAAGVVLTVLAPVNPKSGLDPGAFSVGNEIAARGWITIGSDSPGIATLPAVPGWGWDDIAAMLECARGRGLPLMAKGVLREEDARRAAEIGCGGLIASNIGLRQSSRWVAPADRLPFLRKHFAGPLLLDGGVRSGADILVALCLGANLAIVVRPVITALAARGEAGVFAYLSGLIDTFEASMFWCGVTNPDGLDASLLAPSGAGELP